MRAIKTAGKPRGTNHSNDPFITSKTASKTNVLIPAPIIDFEMLFFTYLKMNIKYTQRQKV